MSSELESRTIAIVEHRFEKELRRLFERRGAQVVSCPLLEEQPIDNRSELQRFIEKLIRGDFDTMVFFTGVGVRFLAEEAESMNQIRPFVSALERLTLVARGPKPKAALGRLGLSVDLAPETHTSEGLLEVLDAEQVNGCQIGVQLYGKPNPEFCRTLVKRGATLSSVQVYNYRPVSDHGLVSDFIDTLLSGSVDCIAFTSAPQVDALFGVAEEVEKSISLVHCLNEELAVAVVGEVANRSLVDRSIMAKIVPAVPKMGALVEAVASYFDEAGR